VTRSQSEESGLINFNRQWFAIPGPKGFRMPEMPADAGLLYLRPKSALVYDVRKGKLPHNQSVAISSTSLDTFNKTPW
jgi:hypothetical protein